MDNIEGEMLNRLPKLVYVRSLIEYEGSLLDLYSLVEGFLYRHALISWIDCDEKDNRWILLENCSLTTSYKFLTGEIPLIEVYKDCKSFIIFDTTQSIEDAKNIIKVPQNKLPEGYFPSKDSFLSHRYIKKDLHV